MFESRPCLDPTEEDISNQGGIFIPDLRRKAKTNCEIVKSTGEKYDGRYKKVGLEISEELLHTNSNVDSM